MIYDVAFSLRSHGSKQKLLDQKIPATYLHLEDIIGDLCVELRQVERDPVLGQEEFENLVRHLSSENRNEAPEKPTQETLLSSEKARGFL